MTNEPSEKEVKSVENIKKGKKTPHEEFCKRRLRLLTKRDKDVILESHCRFLRRPIDPLNLRAQSPNVLDLVQKKCLSLKGYWLKEIEDFVDLEEMYVAVSLSWGLLSQEKKGQ